MGIIERAKNLQINMTFEQKDYMSFTLRRLLHKNLMGELFKVIFAFKSKKIIFQGLIDVFFKKIKKIYWFKTLFFSRKGDSQKAFIRV